MISRNIPRCLHFEEQNVIVFNFLHPEGASRALFKTCAHIHQFTLCPVAKIRILSNITVRMWNSCSSYVSSRTSKSDQERHELITTLRFDKGPVTQCRDMLNILSHVSLPRLTVVHTTSSEARLCNYADVTGQIPTFISLHIVEWKLLNSLLHGHSNYLYAVFDF